MTALGTRRSGPLVGVAAGGALLAHVVAYALVFGDALERRAHLASTGHGAFAPLAMLAVGSAGIAFLVLGVRAVRSEPLPGGLRTAARLAAMQVGLFVLVEIAERGFDLAAASGDPGVRVGLVLQVVVAGILAVVLDLFVKAVRLVADRLRARPAPAPEPFPLGVVERGPFARARWSSATRRGPPLPLTS